MKLKRLKYSCFLFLILILLIGFTAFIYKETNTKAINSFNAELFKSQGFSIEELYLFCDIAFGHEGERLRKWDTDIKVEIKNIAELDRYSIDDVDSVIAVLSPLIAPLKIERVYKGGNLFVYRNMDKIKCTETGDKHANGMAIIERPFMYSWNIESAQVYDSRHSHPHTLMHEFEHALGLEHPERRYHNYLTIGRSAIPQYFSSWYEWAECMSQPYYLSEQEKAVIRMVYSPQVKSGLRREQFIYQMGMYWDFTK